MDSNKQTVIEDGTEFDGSVKSKCAVKLSGKMKGQLSAPSLTVTDSGTVDGKVEVTQLKSHGEISGEIHAESVELAGCVSDDTVINAKTLEVKLNQPDGLQVTFGNCRLQVGDRASKSDGQSSNATHSKAYGEPKLTNN